MDRSAAIERMVEADLARLSDCWSDARDAGEAVPALERVLAGSLGNAAERLFVIERTARGRFRFGVASDRVHLRLGFDASGREIADRAPWPERVTTILERASHNRACVELAVSAETTLGDDAHIAVYLLPVSRVRGENAGFIGFAHAHARSSDTLDEFGLIVRTRIVAAVLARPESRQIAAGALA
ncbi:MAG: PAS domain-containing protein [Alphaproteobacteria bacterium]